jgi:hypothetical protein
MVSFLMERRLLGFIPNVAHADNGGERHRRTRNIFVSPFALAAGAAASGRCRSRRGVRLRRRQRLAHRLRSELGKDRPQHSDARRERIAIVLDDGVKLLGESGDFVVG